MYRPLQNDILVAWRLTFYLYIPPPPPPPPTPHHPTPTPTDIDTKDNLTTYQLMIIPISYIK